MTTPAAVVATAAAADQYPRYRWAIIAQLWMHQSIGFMIFSGLGILLPGMREELGFGPVEAGWLGAARSLGQVLVFPASIVLVRYAPNKVYGICLALAVAAAAVQATAPALPLLMAGLFAYSLAISASQAPGALVRLQWVPLREMATVQGVAQGLGALSQTLGFALIPFLLTIVGGWRGIYAILIGVMGLFTVLWFLTQRERITDRYRNAMAAERGLSSVKAAVRRKEFWLLGLGMFGGAGAYLTALLFLPTFFKEERSFSIQMAGAIVSLMPLGGVVAALTTGFLSDRMGRRKLFIWPAGFVLPVLYWIMLSEAPPLVLYPLAFVLGYFAWAPFAIINTMPFELPNVSPPQVAMGQSLLQTIGTSGILIGPIIAGFVTDAFGSYRIGMLALSPLPLAFALICLWLPETGEKARQE